MTWIEGARLDFMSAAARPCAPGARYTRCAAASVAYAINARCHKYFGDIHRLYPRRLVHYNGLARSRDSAATRAASKPHTRTHAHTRTEYCTSIGTVYIRAHKLFRTVHFRADVIMSPIESDRSFLLFRAGRFALFRNYIPVAIINRENAFVNCLARFLFLIHEQRLYAKSLWLMLISLCRFLFWS